MKLIGILCISASAMFALAAFAGPHISYEYGTVIESIPIVKNFRVSTPVEQCWDQDVVYRHGYYDDGLATVVGAILGGAIGNAVGHKKKNKQIGVVVGAVLGGAIGSSVDSQRRMHTTSYGVEEVCETIHDYHKEERVVGYRVRYRFNNETYVTRTETDPGDTIKLRLAVSPVN